MINFPLIGSRRKSVTSRLIVSTLTMLVLAFLLTPFLVAQHHPEADKNQIFPERTPRDEWQKPVEIIEALNLKPGDTVADIGSGAGYFTGWLSQAVGPHGKVNAVDISEEAIELLKKKIGYYPIMNIDPILCTPTDLKLPASSLDMAFILNTFSVVRHKETMLQNVMNDLKPNGRLVIIDWRSTHDGPPGPPKAERFPEEDVLKMAEQAGFKMDRRFNILPAQYFLEFVKDSHHRNSKP